MVVSINRRVPAALAPLWWRKTLLSHQKLNH